MQAVLFAAGKSTRTLPLTVEKPKPLLKAANRTIIEHNLMQLDGLVSEVIIVIGHAGVMLKERVGSSFGRINIKYVEQKEQNGSGMALLSAKSLLKNRFIAMNSDDFFSKKDIEKCLKHKYCVLAKEVEDISRFGEIIPEGKKARDIKEKPAEKRKGMANCGFYVLDKQIFRHTLKISEREEYEVIDYVKFLIKEGEVDIERVHDYWIPVSYPWNLLDANEFFLSGIKKKIEGKVELGATIKGEVIIGKKTMVKAGAYIEGPVMIGENCIIGPNCYIRASTTIDNNSKIGNAVEVKNSIIGEKTAIGHLSYIGDSVIGDNINIGAGTITANLRHDSKNIRTPVKGNIVDTGRKKLGVIIGDNVHTGIHTSIYPGRKIWPGKTTLPGEVVRKDIE